VKKLFKFGFALFVLAALVVVPLTKPKASVAPEKEWTFLVFLNGDNNLDPYGTADMTEMKLVGSSDQVNVLVLRDTSNSKTSSKIFYMEKGKETLVKDYGANIDMGDWKNLVEFYRFATENYPAKKYAVDIWNHGAGWRKNRQAVDPISRGISYDDNSGNHMTTPQLGEAFRQMRDISGHSVALFGMDACLMEMAEVIYEVADSVNVVVGSEQTEPGDGWAYQGFLAPLVAKPTMDAEELGTLIESSYAASYNGGTQGSSTVQGSAVSAPRLAAAVRTFNDMVAEILPSMPTYFGPIKDATAGTQQYYYNDFKDMLHFLDRLKSRVSNARLIALIDQTMAEFKGAVIANFTTGTTLSNSNGFSVWLPSPTQYASKKALYGDLKWAKDTQWFTLLDKMQAPTFPVVSIVDVQPVRAAGDDFLTPGKAIKFRATLKNDSTYAATGMRLVLVSAGGAVPGVDSVDVPQLNQATMKVDGLTATVSANTVPGSYPFVFRLDIPGLGSLEKTVMIGVDPQYTVAPETVATAHPYAYNTNKTWEISKPGAAAIRVHFSKFATESGYDYVTIMDKDDKVLYTFDGTKDAFWSEPVFGDTVKIKFTADDAVNLYGFDIDKIAY